MTAATLGLFLPLLTYALTMAFTPGPNNLMLASSGANFGLARTIPHGLGVVIGFAVLLTICGMGLGALFSSYPPLQTALKIFGTAYLAYLAWRIATASQAEGKSQSRPLNFLEAAGFQFLNPKGVLSALTTIGTFTHQGADYKQQLVIITIICTLVTLGSVVTWAAFGAAIRQWLSSGRALRLFNHTMAAALLMTIFLIYRQA